MVPQCGTIIPTQKVSPYYIYHQLSIVWTDFLGRENGSTMWIQFVHSLVPHCGTIIPTQKVSPYYIYHQISIVWTDFLGRENGSTMWNHYPDPESQSILYIPSNLYSMD